MQQPGINIPSSNTENISDLCTGFLWTRSYRPYFLYKEMVLLCRTFYVQFVLHMRSPTKYIRRPQIGCRILKEQHEHPSHPEKKVVRMFLKRGFPAAQTQVTCDPGGKIGICFPICYVLSIVAASVGIVHKIVVELDSDPRGMGIVPCGLGWRAMLVFRTDYLLT